MAGRSSWRREPRPPEDVEVELKDTVVEDEVKLELEKPELEESCERRTWPRTPLLQTTATQASCSAGSDEGSRRRKVASCFLARGPRLTPPPREGSEEEPALTSAPRLRPS